VKGDHAILIPTWRVREMAEVGAHAVGGGGGFFDSSIAISGSLDIEGEVPISVVALGWPT